LLLAILPDILERLLGALSDSFDTLLCALAEPLDALLRTLAQLGHALLGSAPDSGHSLARTVADLCDRAPCTLPGALDRVPGVGQQVMRATAHVAERIADALEQLRVAVERGQDTSEDSGHIVQADLHERLRLDALYVQFHLPQPHSHAGVQLHEMAGLGQYRKVRPEVVKLELDLVDLHHGGVHIHVDRFVDVVGIDD
jgi:hypothetical protein